MLRYALRRVFWIIPVLLGATIALFALLTRAPASGSRSATSSSNPALPVFLNLRPRDVRALSADAVDRIVAQADVDEAAALLCRLGGAAFPFVLPQLDSLDPAARERVALALVPVAARMGLTATESLRRGPDAVTFWTLYWQERSADFKPAVARRAVRRLATQGSDARRTELVELDTYALGGLMDALGEVRTPEDVARVSRLTDVASHVTGRDDTVGPGASVSQARACVNRWQDWWLASRVDYEPLTGPSRVAAMLVETRYGHWVLRAITWQLGTAEDGQPVVDKLLRHAPRTLALAMLGLVGAHGVGLAIGLLAAWRRRAWIGWSTTLFAVIALAVPAPLIVLAVAHATGGALLAGAAGIAITVAFAGSPSRHQRLAALDVSLRDVTRYARARGVSDAVLLLRHLLRPTIIAVLPLFATDFPLALSCACAAEKALGLRGIGLAIVRAAIDHDVAFLMAAGISFTGIAAMMHAATDMITAMMDRRTMRHLLQERA
jgi:peptide/nickel transport system permease protein